MNAEELNEYYLSLSKKEKKEFDKKFAAADPFGFDADCRWDTVNHLVGMIISSYSSLSFKNDSHDDYPYELIIKISEMRNHHFEKTGTEYEDGIVFLKEELEKVTKMLSDLG